MMLHCIESNKSCYQLGEAELCMHRLLFFKKKIYMS